MEPDDRPIRFPFLDTLDRPEIEDDFGSAHYLRYRSSLQSTRTSVDVLDLKGSLRSDIQWRQNLDHDALLSHFGVDDEACNSAENSVRVLFLSARIVDEDGTLPANYSRRLRGKNSTVAASAATLEWLCIRFGVSLLFLDCIIRISWGIKPGNACFTQRNESGNIERVDALYHIFQYNMPCRVWFTYSTESRITTYIIFNCAFEAKSSILNLALSSNHQKLRRAAVVDAIIINAGAWELKKDAQYNRGVLLDYEMAGAAAAQIPSNESLSAFQRLHDLSQAWHVLTENLRDQLEVMEFISAFHRKHVPSYGMSLKHSAHESIEFLISQHHIWLRWVANYNVRTQIRINLGFNMASQSDNRINIKIADTSTKIAEAARKDSSSMITIAALTMLFLPGTFVSVSLPHTLSKKSDVDTDFRLKGNL
ncbi:hypothetical protein MMC21_000156 [Puttea exsequens]|nr:hypothetical protein [Puttea exsequens]